MKKTFPVAALALALGVVAGCGGASETPPAATAGAAEAIGSTEENRAPSFELESIGGGEPLRLADYDGKVRLVDFWAIWCKPCVQELPMLQGLQDRYGADGFQMIGVYHSDEQPDEVRAFLDERGISYPQAIGNDDVADAFGGILGLPAAFLIDREGRIVQRYGGEKVAKKLECEIRESLGLPAES